MTIILLIDFGRKGLKLPDKRRHIQKPFGHISLHTQNLRSQTKLPVLVLLLLDILLLILNISRASAQLLILSPDRKYRLLCEWDGLVVVLMITGVHFVFYVVHGGLAGDGG